MNQVPSHPNQHLPEIYKINFKAEQNFQTKKQIYFTLPGSNRIISLKT